MPKERDMGNFQYEHPKVSAMPLIPLRGVLVFPHVVVHLDVGRERSIKALDEAMLNNREIFLAMQKEAQLDDPALDDIYHVGTIAEIKQILKLPGGTIRLVAEGLYRGELKSLLKTEPYLVAEVEARPETLNVSPLELEALIRHLRSLFEQYINLNKKIPAEILLTVNSIEDSGRLADIIANNLNLQLPERQEILEAVDVADRIELLLGIITKEMDLLEIERKISGRVRRQVEKNQKEYYLREQIRAIQKELGENEDRTGEIEEIKERMSKRDLPDNVKEKIEKELSRLRAMPPMVGEASVVHTYIDWLLDLPWKEETEDANDLLKAEEVLNNDHYGIFKVKERILEYLAVRQMTNSLKGPILCFVGPPGVGKTSLAKSIATALNRKYIRISLGGVRDEAEIRGHRRTYIGAMPGRIIQSMKNGGTVNPLFLLDEIDKLANDFRGDPASALLEVLDPEQNNTFADHYIELPYDLSKVMFITTANVEYDIPRPLLDRMEIIRLSGYTEEEKVQIAIKHLVPKQYKEHGLEGKQIFISENAIRIIIREYTREAGVRSLERHIAKICRRIVRDIVAGKANSGKITAQNVKEYLGVPRFRYDTVDKYPQIGVVTGLAWTEVGGEVLTIEAQTMEGKGKLILTGQLGDVMKESAQTGWTYLRSIGKEIGIPANVEENTDLHIHVPEGAIPKDGPSAGISMATALASIFSKRKVRQDVAMTGEITLRGRVLPIGGVKEKVLAAHRGGAKVIILPADNKKDLEDIPSNVKRKLEFHLVENLREVLEIALLPAANKKKVSASKPVKQD
jgi:ATP-dependent Lon protease